MTYVPSFFHDLRSSIGDIREQTIRHAGQPDETIRYSGRTGVKDWQVWKRVGLAVAMLATTVFMGPGFGLLACALSLPSAMIAIGFIAVLAGAVALDLSISTGSLYMLISGALCLHFSHRLLNHYKMEFWPFSWKGLLEDTATESFA